jgi:hypothetical protein
VSSIGQDKPGTYSSVAPTATVEEEEVNKEPISAATNTTTISPTPTPTQLTGAIVLAASIASDLAWIEEVRNP